MSSYSTFFKNAKKTALASEPSMVGAPTVESLLSSANSMDSINLAKKKNSSTARSNEDAIQEAMKTWAQGERKKKRSTPLKKPRKVSAHIQFLGLICLLGSLWTLSILFKEDISWLSRKIELKFTSAEAAATEDKKDPPEGKENGAVSPEAAKEGEKSEKAKDEKLKAAVATDSKEAEGPRPVVHLMRLEERARELDAREKELDKAEAELQKEKVLISEKLKELEQQRQNISKLLSDKVQIDEQKIESLVQVYTSMKPITAAKVFDNMDEDLAIEIITRMKKKNAADILNLVKPEKAQILSEKFAGYKRK